MSGKTLEVVNELDLLLCSEMNEEDGNKDVVDFEALLNDYEAETKSDLDEAEEQSTGNSNEGENSKEIHLESFFGNDVMMGNGGAVVADAVGNKRATK